ncbi:MAG: stage II sporulation protein M [Clostridiaceae bacterium]|nr:stage II sporulation protein M [Clostridiaceae bacterium]
MTEDRFIHMHSNTWKQFEDILNTIQKKGYEKTSFSMLRTLDYLYRQVSGHLAYAQTFFPDSEVYHYLNNIVSRGHNCFYTRKKNSIGSILFFYLKDVPRTLISNWRFFAISCALFLMASLFSFAYTWQDTKNAYVFLPEQIIEGLQIKEQGNTGWNHPIMSGIIMTNNIRVALLAFAYGISIGIGTIYILLQNGFILGSLSALAMKQGAALVYWSLILPHGIIELCAIFISGAAGLKIGYRLLRPGQYSRKDALVIAGKEALKLMGLVVPMLIIAGIIEGFITPSSFSPYSKLAFAGFTFLLLLAYLSLGCTKKHVS